MTDHGVGEMGKAASANLKPCRSEPHALELLGSGSLAEIFDQ
jgi:hypothetical protein